MVSQNTVATYGIVVALAAIAYTILQTVIVPRSQGPESSLKDALGRDLKAKISLAGYLASIPRAFALRRVSIGIFVGVAIT